MVTSRSDDPAPQPVQTKESALSEGLNALLPPSYMKVVGFLIPSHEMTDELVDWYENEHSTAARFQWPYMNLYQRNFILDTEVGT